MNRIHLLRELIDELKSIDNETEEFKYLGTGHPNSDMLIIGKEASIHLNKDQKKREIDNNLKDWDSITNKDHLPEVEPWNGTNYSPLYHRRTTLFKGNGEKCRTSTGPDGI